MITTDRIGNIKENGIATGWSVEKVGNKWILLNFDDDVVDTFKLRRDAVECFSDVNMV